MKLTIETENGFSFWIPVPLNLLTNRQLLELVSGGEIKPYIPFIIEMKEELQEYGKREKDFPLLEVESHDGMKITITA